MMRMKIECSRPVEFSVNEVAEAMANLNSTDFGQLMQTFTDYLSSGCGNRAKTEVQECWIARDLPEDAKEFFKSVVEFIKMNEEEVKS